jgi:hypothetical protein
LAVTALEIANSYLNRNREPPFGATAAAFVGISFGRQNGLICAASDRPVEAITRGRIRSVVADLYADELAGRPPRPELSALPQILLTRHISASGDIKTARPQRRLFADNLRRYLDGQPLLNVVDHARGY